MRCQFLDAHAKIRPGIGGAEDMDLRPQKLETLGPRLKGWCDD